MQCRSTRPQGSTFHRATENQKWQAAALVAALCLFCVPAATSFAQSPLPRHAEKLAWQMESWSSIELEVREKLIRPDGWSGRPLDFDVIVHHYIETAAGQRLLDDRCETSGKITSRDVQFFDGKQGASLVYDPKNLERQQQIIIHRHFGSEDRFVQTTRPVPLFWYWVGRTPLHKALRDAQFVGERQVMGRNCDIVLFQRAGGTTGTRDQIYYLDKETSAPLKVEVYRDAKDRLAGRLLKTWEAKDLGNEGGRPLIKEGVEREYSGEGGKPSVTREYRVVSVAYDKKYPKSTFWPEPEPGANVFDTINDKIVSPQPTAKQTSPKADTAPTDVPPNALRADPPRTWTDYATPVAIALGVAALLTSVFMWRRHG